MFPAIEGKDFYTDDTVKVADLLDNKMTLVNVWASRYTTSRKEHQKIKKIAKNTDLQNGAQYLEIMGNPFDEILFDPDGKIGMDLGVYATPETFLVDKKGMILYKHIGEIDQNVWDKKFVVHLNPVES